MKIIVNDKEIELSEGSTVTDAINTLGIGQTGVAIAIGDEIVPKNLWESTKLNDGAELTLIRAVCGG